MLEYLEDLILCPQNSRTSLVAQLVKNLSPVQATAFNARDLGLIPGLGRSPGEEMATHSSILAWKIPGIEEPGGWQSMGSQRVRHNWVWQLKPSAPRFPKLWTQTQSICFLVFKLSDSLSHTASFPGSPASRCQTMGLLSLHNQTSSLYQISFNVCLLACLSICLSVYLSILLVLFLWRPLIKAVKLFCMIQVIQNV